MSASTSEKSPVRVKAKPTSGWAALQRQKHQNLESINFSEAYPLLSLTTTTTPGSSYKNGALLKKPFSSVLEPSMDFPSLVDTANRNSQRQVTVSNYCHNSSENFETDDFTIESAYQKLKYLHPWADESLIQDVIAGVNNNVDEALSLLEVMLISETENKDVKVEPSVEYIASPINTEGCSVGENPDVSCFATNDSSSNKESIFDLLLGASKSLPIEPESDSEDDDLYLIHRKEAIRVQRSASRHSKASKVAYLKGDRTLALQLSLKAQQEWTAAEKLNAKAAKEILNVRNCKNDQWTLDLHGLHAAEAVEALRERLQTVESLVSKKFLAIPDHDGVYYNESGTFTRVKMEKFGRQLPLPAKQRQTLLQVITGKGNHSRGAAALPSAVRNFLSENGYHFDETRSGVIMIRPKFRQQ